MTIAPKSQFVKIPLRKKGGEKKMPNFVIFHFKVHLINFSELYSQK